MLVAGSTLEWYWTIVVWFVGIGRASGELVASPPLDARGKKRYGLVLYHRCLGCGDWCHPVREVVSPPPHLPI